MSIPAAVSAVGRRTGSWSTTALLAAAAALALVSAGSVWGSVLDSRYQPGWYTPGYCVTVYDYEGWASLDCTAGYLAPGWTTADLVPVPGYAGTGRVLIVAAVVLVLLAYRRGSAALATTALLVAIAAPVLNGLHATPGQLLWWTAIALTATAFHRQGLLPHPRSSAHAERQHSAEVLRTP